MRYAISCTLLVGVLMLFRWPDQPAADDGRKPPAGSDADALAEITVRVPTADLKTWDPMNSNVNPIPWRVYGPADIQKDRTATFRHQAIGEAIGVEGIAWGYVPEQGTPTSGVPQSRVLFEGGLVLVKGADFNQPEIHGRLVRVEGTLRREAIPRRPGFQLEFPEYYFVDVSGFTVIDAVSDPHVVRQKPNE